MQKHYCAKVRHLVQESNSFDKLAGISDSPFFVDEISLDTKIKKKGLVGTANVGPNMNTSDFFITLTDQHLKALDDKHTIFGEVAEGHEILEKLNRVHVNDENRPLANVRILHTHVLEDPFADPEFYVYPESPEAIYEGIDKPDYDMNLEVNITDAKDAKELDELKKQKRSRVIAHNLTLLEDRPDPDLKPPENVLFVCKLNPVTTERDLELIFSRFGAIKRCDVIRDWKTGQSLMYAFMEFETKMSCEEAYFKMENALIDERRIHVDFSQSVAKFWNKNRAGRNINVQDLKNLEDAGKFNTFAEDSKNGLPPIKKKEIREVVKRDYEARQKSQDRDQKKRRSRSPRNRSRSRSRDRRHERDSRREKEKPKRRRHDSVSSKSSDRRRPQKHRRRSASSSDEKKSRERHEKHRNSSGRHRQNSRSRR